MGYDDAGNLTDDGVLAYSYDAWNRQTAAKRPASGTQIAANAYDGLHRRASKVVSKQGVEASPGDGGNTTVHFYYTGWRVAETRSGANAATAQYVWGTQYIDEAVVLDRDSDADGDCLDAGGSERLTYHQDANFRVVALTDSTGGVVERYEYSAYGEPQVLRGSPTAGGAEAGNMLAVSAYGNPLLRQGLWRDNESGTYQNRFRVLHSRQGRFGQRDPAGYVDGQNLTIAMSNNPYARLDFMGLDDCDDAKERLKQHRAQLPNLILDLLDSTDKLISLNAQKSEKVGVYNSIVDALHDTGSSELLQRIRDSRDFNNACNAVEGTTVGVTIGMVHHVCNSHPLVAITSGIATNIIYWAIGEHHEGLMGKIENQQVAAMAELEQARRQQLNTVAREIHAINEQIALTASRLKAASARLAIHAVQDIGLAADVAEACKCEK